MLIKTFPMGPLEVNTYVIACEETKEAALIDFGGYHFDQILQFVEENNLKLQYLLLTHGHFDHSMGAKEVQEKLNIPIYISKEDEKVLSAMSSHLAMYGMKGASPPKDVEFIDDKKSIMLGNLELQIIHTPGHTQGCVCYYIESEKVMFVGDTIFEGAIGRTDLPGGSYEQIMDSINKKILQLGDDILLYCGHGPSTTLGNERIYNPFFGFSSQANR